LERISPAAICDALNKLENSNLRESLISKGMMNAKKYSWDIMAKQYLDVYFLLWEKYK
jgi:glycosyltransferase involved in cell wall biosynthesis